MRTEDARCVILFLSSDKGSVVTFIIYPILFFTFQDNSPFIRITDVFISNIETIVSVYIQIFIEKNNFVNRNNENHNNTRNSNLSKHIQYSRQLKFP